MSDEKNNDKKNLPEPDSQFGSDAPETVPLGAPEPAPTTTPLITSAAPKTKISTTRKTDVPAKMAAPVSNVTSGPPTEIPITPPPESKRSQKAVKRNTDKSRPRILLPIAAAGLLACLLIGGGALYQNGLYVSSRTKLYTVDFEQNGPDGFAATVKDRLPEEMGKDYFPQFAGSDLFPKFGFNDNFLRTFLARKLDEKTLQSIAENFLGARLDTESILTGTFKKLFFYGLNLTPLNCSLETADLTSIVCASKSVSWHLRPFLRIGAYLYSTKSFRLADAPQWQFFEITKSRKKIYLASSGNGLLVSFRYDALLHFLARPALDTQADPRASFPATDIVDNAMEKYGESDSSRWKKDLEEKKKLLAEKSFEGLPWIDAFYLSSSSESLTSKFSNTFAYGAFAADTSEAVKGIYRIQAGGNFFKNLALQKGGSAFKVASKFPSASELDLAFRYLTPKVDSLENIERVVETLDNNLEKIPPENSEMAEFGMSWAPQNLYEAKDIFKFVMSGAQSFPNNKTNFGFAVYSPPLSRAEFGNTEGDILGTRLVTKIKNDKKSAEFDPAHSLLYVATNPKMLESFSKATLLEKAFSRESDNEESQLFARFSLEKLLGQKGMEWNCNRFSVTNGLYSAEFTMQTN